MYTLTQSPFNLAPGELVQIKARARNSNGWGQLSEKNIEGVKVFTTPTKIAKI